MTDSLLHRLQSLTKPDSEIDAEIALANGWECKKYKGGICCRRPGMIFWQPEPPRYTESLDAALTLITGGRTTWNIGKWLSNSGDGAPVYWADLHLESAHWQARHEFAPIALLIAWAKMMESNSALSGKEE